MPFGRVSVEFWTDMEVGKLQEDFNDFVVKKGEITLINVEGQQGRLIVDSHTLDIVIDDEEE